MAALSENKIAVIKNRFTSIKGRIDVVDKSYKNVKNANKKGNYQIKAGEAVKFNDALTDLGAAIDKLHSAVDQIEEDFKNNFTPSGKINNLNGDVNTVEDMFNRLNKYLITDQINYRPTKAAYNGTSNVNYNTKPSNVSPEVAQKIYEEQLLKRAESKAENTQVIEIPESVRYVKDPSAEAAVIVLKRQLKDANQTIQAQADVNALLASRLNPLIEENKRLVAENRELKTLLFDRYRNEIMLSAAKDLVKQIQAVDEDYQNDMPEWAKAVGLTRAKFTTLKSTNSAFHWGLTLTEYSKYAQQASKNGVKLPMLLTSLGYKQNKKSDYPEFIRLKAEGENILKQRKGEA